MMKSFRSALAALACMAATGSAAILVNYNFDNGAGTPSVLETEATAGNFTPSGGITTAGQPVVFPVVSIEGNAYGWTGAPSANIAGTSTANPGTEALSVSSNDYYSFTVTPTTGNGFNFSTLTFGTGFYVVGGGTFTLHGYFFVRSSINNYATTISSVFEAAHETIATGGVPSFGEATVDLSGRPEYQNVAGPVTFRIYLYDDSNAATRYVSIDNVTLSGDLVPVPEPSACVLSLAASALAARRRRF